MRWKSLRHIRSERVLRLPQRHFHVSSTATATQHSRWGKYDLPFSWKATCQQHQLDVHGAILIDAWIIIRKIYRTLQRPRRYLVFINSPKKKKKNSPRYKKGLSSQSHELYPGKHPLMVLPNGIGMTFLELKLQRNPHKSPTPASRKIFL